MTGLRLNFGHNSVGSTGAAALAAALGRNAELKAIDLDLRDNDMWDEGMLLSWI